jgi:hypothetical protein
MYQLNFGAPNDVSDLDSDDAHLRQNIFHIRTAN